MITAVEDIIGAAISDSFVNEKSTQISLHDMHPTDRAGLIHKLTEAGWEIDTEVRETPVGATRPYDYVSMIGDKWGNRRVVMFIDTSQEN